MTSLLFPPPPVLEGLTFLRVEPCVLRDRRVGALRTKTFPIYHYRNVQGELILVCEEQYEEVLDRLMMVDGGAQ